jgi:hypothetical protein
LEFTQEQFNNPLCGIATATPSAASYKQQTKHRRPQTASRNAQNAKMTKHNHRNTSIFFLSTYLDVKKRKKNSEK